ncbi:MAG TPA: alpha/beta hydrolase [Kofleriaceae bacterium]|nr:alpha/beta hydrolase [Kofleriaceae bacterium]
MPGKGGPKTVTANGVELCVETFGDDACPAILLIGGNGGAMDYWEDDFCRLLAEGARFVLRYDLRDTGQSVTYEAGAPPYTGGDLVADVVGLLDAFGLARASIVGVSMGGAMAQVVAIEHPARVAALVLMSTSSGPGGAGSDSPDLPPVSAKLQAHFAREVAEPDWSRRDAVIDHLVAEERAYAGSLPRDEDARRALAGRVFDRTIDMASSAKNHALLRGDGEPLRPRLGLIRAPTLVLHGTEDPLFPYAHGVALAAEIPGAELVPLAGVGHEYPPRAVWRIVVPAIVRHTARATAESGG